MDKTWYEEVKEDFVKNINDSYTLNLALSILEDREELLKENLDIQNKAYEDGILDSIKEVQRLDKILKELRSWLEEQEKKAWDEVSSTFGYVLDKLNELEGGKND